MFCLYEKGIKTAHGIRDENAKPAMIPGGTIGVRIDGMAGRLRPTTFEAVVVVDGDRDPFCAESCGHLVGDIREVGRCNTLGVHDRVDRQRLKLDSHRGFIYIAVQHGPMDLLDTGVDDVVQHPGTPNDDSHLEQVGV